MQCFRDGYIFLRFCLLKPVKDLKTLSNISAFQSWMHLLDALQNALSGDGTQFPSEKFRTFTKTFNIKQQFATPWYLECNGLYKVDERTIGLNLYWCGTEFHWWKRWLGWLCWNWAACTCCNPKYTDETFTKQNSTWWRFIIKCKFRISKNSQQKTQLEL